MTVELSRRLFLFGSAAALAAAAVPVAIAESAIAAPIFTPVPALAPYLRREVWGILAGFEPSVSDPHGPATIQIGRHNGPNILQWGMDTRSTYLWRAMPMRQIIVPDHSPLRMSVLSPRALGRVIMTCHDIVDEGPPVELVENHTFPPIGQASATVCYLHPDNSLTARLARKEEARLAAIRWEKDEAAGLHDDDDRFDDGYVPGTLPTLPWR